MILLGSTSWCHNSRSIIVRSRANGFVTQNCEVCGTPRALPKSQLPPFNCQRCGRSLETFTNINSNYAYACRSCGMEVELAGLVPHWDELFDYHGYPLESDLVSSPRPLTAEEMRAILASVHSSRAAE